MMNSKNKNRKVHTWIKELGDQQSEDVYRSARGVRDATWAMTKGGKQNIIAITPLKTISQRRKAQKKWPRENKRKQMWNHFVLIFSDFSIKCRPIFLLHLLLINGIIICRVRLNNQIEKCHRNFWCIFRLLLWRRGVFPQNELLQADGVLERLGKNFWFILLFFLFLLLGICNKILKNGKRKIWKPEG